MRCVLEVFEVRLDRIAPVAGQALDQGVRAVQLDQPLGACPGLGVQSVDILGYDCRELARAFEIVDRAVRRIRLRLAEHFPAFELVVPVLDAGGFRLQKALIVDRPALGPGALRSAEVRDAAGGGDASAGEDHDPLCRAQVACQLGPPGCRALRNSARLPLDQIRRETFARGARGQLKSPPAPAGAGGDERMPTWARWQKR